MEFPAYSAEVGRHASSDQIARNLASDPKCIVDVFAAIKKIGAGKPESFDSASRDQGRIERLESDPRHPLAKEFSPSWRCRPVLAVVDIGYIVRLAIWAAYPAHEKADSFG